MYIQGIKIIDNLYNGECGLWYKMLIEKNGEKVSCVCPFTECKTFYEAIGYYFLNFHNEGNKIIHLCYEKLSVDTLNTLSKCA
jgi:hypothetical protein